MDGIISLTKQLRCVYKWGSSPRNAVGRRLSIRKLSSLAVVKEAPQLDWAYVLSPRNTQEIKRNIAQRKGIGDVDALVCNYSSIPICTAMRKKDVAY